MTNTLLGPLTTSKIHCTNNTPSVWALTGQDAPRNKSLDFIKLQTAEADGGHGKLDRRPLAQVKLYWIEIKSEVKSKMPKLVSQNWTGAFFHIIPQRLKLFHTESNRLIFIICGTVKSPVQQMNWEGQTTNKYISQCYLYDFMMKCNAYMLILPNTGYSTSWI